MDEINHLVPDFALSVRPQPAIFLPIGGFVIEHQALSSWSLDTPKGLLAKNLVSNL